MTTYEVLDASKHKSIKIHKNAGVEFAKTQHLISVRVTEVDKAISSFPVFFFRNHQTGKLSIAVMTSFKPSNNLFVKDNEWDACYMPSTIATHPFYVTSDDNSDSGYALTINTQSPLVNTEEGNVLFGENGKASSYLNQVKSKIDAELKNEMVTREFLQTIDDLNLTMPIDLEMEFADGTSETISGLHTVAEEKLRLLEDELLCKLNKQGYLIPLHGALMSLFQVNGLIKRNNSKFNHTAIKNIHLRLQQNNSV